MATFRGNCRFRLIEGFFSCNPGVLLTRLGNGRSIFTFAKGDTIFSLSGGKDRQPNLENYFLSIDTIRMLRKGKSDAVDDGMEGECHLRINAAGTKAYVLKCDIYNREKGTRYNFYLDNISSLTRKTFNAR